MTEDLLRIEYVPLEEVQRWPRNPKKHDMGALVAAIERYGFVDPPKFDQALGALVYGNGRDEALEWMKVQGRPAPRGIRVDEEGRWLVPIKFGVDAPSQGEAEALAIDHNNLTMSGGDFTAFDMARMWDAGYAELLEGLRIDDALPLTIDEEALASLLSDQPDSGGGGDNFDPTPAVEGPTRTAVGDLWVIGDKHRLVVGDCTDPLVVERLMGGGEINCVFTSPPYDQQRTYEGNMALDWRALVSGACLLAARHCASDAQLFVNLGLIHRDGRVVRYWDNFIADMEDEGWPLFGWYVWDKLNGMPGDWNGRLAPAHEWVFHFCREVLRPRKTVKTKHEGARVGISQRERDGSLKSFTHAGVPIQPFKIPDSVVRLTQQRPDELVNGHPAPFPVALPETFLHAYAGDLWYDPFLGSGTSILAAERAGRRCAGAEINPRYADLSLARAEAAGLTCVKESHA